MRVIITGGTGFLGRHLVWHLSGQGHDVSFTGRNIPAAQLVLSMTNRPVQFVALDHGSEAAALKLDSLIAGADAVVHCAALSSPWGSPADFRRANVESTRQVVNACHASKVSRLVYVSTPSVYFCYENRLDIRETDRLPKPVNLYAATKREAEVIVSHSGIEQCAIMRPRAIFGPWDNTLMPRLLRVLDKGLLPVPNQGKALLDLTYVDNVVHAIALALAKTLPSSCATYNVSNGEPLYFRDLLQQLQRVLKKPIRTLNIPYRLLDTLARLAELHAGIARQGEPMLTRYSAGTLAFSQTLNLDAIRSDLGYLPPVSVGEGIQRYADWLSGQGMHHAAN